jgi:DNA-binding transcriptional LysR family regulator
MKLRSLDLNLLVALDALLEERSVTRAAAKMGLAQPTLSASLSRLRRHFGDDLLVRSGNEYQLTPLGARLRDRVRIAVADLDRIFQSRSAFNPSETTREFRLLMSDYALALVVGPLADLLKEEAPHARLCTSQVQSTTMDLPEQSFLSHDLLFMPHGFVLGMPHQDIFEDEWICIVATDNPLVGETLTAEHLSTLPWVASYFGPTSSTPALRQLRTLGTEPHIQVTTDSYLAIPRLVAHSDRVSMLPKRLLHGEVPLDEVRLLPCPLPVGHFVEAIWWHPLNHEDPEHVYLRNAVARVCEAIAGPLPAGAGE